MRVYVSCRMSLLVSMAALVVLGLGQANAQTIIAFGEPGHSATTPGTVAWFGNGTNIAESYPFPQDDGATSTWDFTGLANGTYNVSVDWTAFSNRTTMARYSMSDGGGDVVIDQQSSVRDFYEFVDGVPVGWLNLGQVTIADGTFSVTASDDDDVLNGEGFLMADAIRLSTSAGVTNVPGIGKGIVVDDGDAGHQFIGESGSDPVWIVAGGGFDEDNSYDIEAGGAQHTGVLQSEWTITGLTPGLPVDVAATWTAFSNRGTNVPYTISGIEGGDQTVLVNQQPAPNADVYAADITGNARPFQDLGTFIATGTTVTITMSNDANGFAIADAVRVFQYEPLNLVVNTDTGSMKILNEGADTYDVDVYEITSAEGSLDATNWESLEEQGVPGWMEGGSSDEFELSEFNLSGMSTFGPGANQYLGLGYDTSVDAGNLVFTFVAPDGTVLEGFVTYVTNVLGDMNGDGVVDTADVNPFVQALTDRDAFELAYPGVDADAVGDVNGSSAFNLGDVAAFKALVAGSSAATSQAVPEPSSALLLALSLVGFGAFRTRRSK